MAQLTGNLFTELDAITAEYLRSQASVKWSRYGDDAIGAFVAEMDFGTAPCITEALHAAVDAASFGYLPPSLVTAMAEAWSTWQRDRHGWDISPESVFPMPDVIRTMEVAIDFYSRAGSPVILPTPAYMPFLTVPGWHGRAILEVPMAREADGRLALDLDGIDRAYAAGGDLLVLCNPYNPVGRVFTREELAGVTEVVDRHGGRVFSDEIHGALTFPGHEHVPYASTSDTAAGHSVTATSASKAWNLPGLKCAQLAITNQRDAEIWSRVGFMASHGAANLGVVAATAAYRDGGPWLDGVLAYLDRNRSALDGFLAEHLPGARWTPPEGTYLAWLDLRDTGAGDHPGPFFAERAKVGLVDGIACGTPGLGHARLNFATPLPVLNELVERMGAAVAPAG